MQHCWLSSECAFRIWMNAILDANSTSKKKALMFICCSTIWILNIEHIWICCAIYQNTVPFFFILKPSSKKSIKHTENGNFLPLQQTHKDVGSVFVWRPKKKNTFISWFWNCDVNIDGKSLFDVIPKWFYA
jgi:hypothetical protein